MRRRRRWTPQTCEALEARALLAGNMTAELIGTTYVLTGDSLDNAVGLYSEGTDFIIRGLNATTVEGQEILRIPKSQLSQADSFFARGGAGNDDMLIDFTGMTWDGRADILGGGGNDTLTVVGSTIATSARIGGGSGHDTLAVRGINIAGDLQIDAGNGNDTILLNDIQVGDDLGVVGGSGRDFAWLESSTIGDNARFRMGQRADWLVVADTTVSGKLTASGQRGTDTFVNDAASNSFGSLTETSNADVFTALTDWRDANPTHPTFTASDTRTNAHRSLISTVGASLPPSVRTTLDGVFGDTIPNLFFP